MEEITTGWKDIFVLKDEKNFMKMAILLEKKIYGFNATLI